MGARFIVDLIVVAQNVTQTLVVEVARIVQVPWCWGTLFGSSAGVLPVGVLCRGRLVDG